MTDLQVSLYYDYDLGSPEDRSRETQWSFYLFYFIYTWNMVIMPCIFVHKAVYCIDLKRILEVDFIYIYI